MISKAKNKLKLNFRTSVNCEGFTVWAVCCGNNELLKKNHREAVHSSFRSQEEIGEEDVRGRKKSALFT